MSSKVKEVLTRLNMENKLIVEIKGSTTLLFIHKDTGVMLWKMDKCVCSKELQAVWSK